MTKTFWMPAYNKPYITHRVWEGGFTKYGYGETAEAAIADSAAVPADWPEAEQVITFQKTERTKKTRYGIEHLYTKV